MSGKSGGGVIVDPVRPTEFVVAVQHPDSTDLASMPNGLGDAVWQFDIAAVENQKFISSLEKARKKGPKN